MVKQYRTMQRSLLLFEEGIKSPHTKKVYRGHLAAFLKFAKISDPDKLLELPRDQLQLLLEDYVFHIKKRINPNSVPTSLQGIKHFFTMSDVMINWKKLSKFYPEKIKRTGYRSWTSDEISKMLQCTTKLRNIAIIHFLASTGARVGVFEHDFNLKHIKDISDGCKSVQLYAGFKEEYTSFLTPEASSTLDEYLAKRRQDGEVLTDESPVFRARYLLGQEPAKALHHNGFRMVIYRIIEKSGIIRKKLGQRYDVQVDHGFRKRFNTILKIQNDINSNIAEKLVGHSTSIPLDNAYLPADDPLVIEKCFTEFKKAIPFLTISKEERQKIKIETLESKQQELDELKDNMESIISEKINQYSSKFIKDLKKMMDESAIRSSIKMKKSDLKLFRKISENDDEFGKIKSVYNNL